jgi:hypothetical protein
MPELSCKDEDVQVIEGMGNTRGQAIAAPKGLV